TLTEEGLTVAGRVLGTTDYVAPEQALGQPVTGQSDLYSLGVVLYEMLTGDVPFHGETPVAVAMKHVREEPPDVQRMRPEVSAATVGAHAGIEPVQLSQTAAHSYNPFGTGPENRDQVDNVVDNDPNTTWSTEQYYEGTLKKQGGVGLGVYLDAAPGVAARQLAI